MRKPSIRRLVLIFCIIWILLVTVILFNHVLLKSSVNKIIRYTPIPPAEPIHNTTLVQLPTNLLWSSVTYDLNDKTRLRSIIEAVNELQFIRNPQFIPDVSSMGTVLLIQVHTRLTELEILIQSLRHVQGIENTLVIFSHDVFRDDMNRVIENIKFYPVMQIFFPYSLQVYNGRFPDDSTNDCPREIKVEKAKEIGCVNADHPDHYGHYREGKYSQMKHHWLWKIDFVFHKIRILNNFKGMLLRLDNDYYLGPDIIHVMRIMRQHGDPLKMLIMGNYEDFKNEDFAVNGTSFSSGNWYTGVGRGMAFTKELWNKIAGCGHIFCTFDDYNWDYSLQRVVTSCMDGIAVLKPKGSRIFHAGQCNGFHRHQKCSSKDMFEKIKTYLHKNEQYFFPQNLTFHNVETVQILDEKKVGYGGWADPRDHQLCRAILKSPEDVDRIIRLYSHK